MKTASLILLLGTNMPDRIVHLRSAISFISIKLGHVKAVSGVYSTQSWGFQSEDFLNMALSVETSLSSRECLQISQKIEQDMGRSSKSTHESYEDRVIDIDLIFYDSEIVNNENLTIPHPRLGERKFVLYPLADIIPEFLHPINNQTITEILKQCTDVSQVTLIHEQI